MPPCDIADATGVWAVTVTYGERATLCRQVVNGAFRAGASGVVIVDNGSAPSAAEALTALQSAHEGRVEIVRLAENLGSAAGFAAGMAAALEMTSARYVWLLDDDTEPQPNALEQLLHWQLELSGGQPDREVGLISFRPAREYQRLIVGGYEVRDVYPSLSSFAEFHVIDALKKLQRRTRPNVETISRTRPIGIPYGPYGGLLLPCRLVEAVGLPDARLFTYEDDTEYTHRVSAGEGSLYLVPSSELTDLETSWPDQASGRSMFSRSLSTAAADRAFYRIRNRIYFENHYWRGSPLVFAVNRILFIVILWLHACLLRRMDRFTLIMTAVHQGERSELGRASVGDLR
jgi:GT2 family glycosyltransferase